ncbi:MAG: ferredoxin family protein [Ignavibacteriales bacterium]
MVPVVKRQWCKGCGICVEFCPKKSLALDKDHKAYVAKPGECSGCKLCEMRCPDFAISCPGGDRE